MRHRALLVLVSGALLTTLTGLSPAAGLGYNHSRVVSADPVDTTPHVRDGSVLAIATIGDTVYVGGTFHAVTRAGTSAQIPRDYLFAFNRGSGQVSSFAPALDGAVDSIAPGPNGTIIIGGRFRNVEGTAQRSVAMLRADGTRVSTFSATTNGSVAKVLVRGTRLVAGGRFSRANGTARTNLAVFNATSGALDTRFNLPVTQGRTRGNGTVSLASVQEMDADAGGSRLVIVGNFRAVGGQPRQQVAMINLSGNSLAGWFTNRYPNGVVGTAQGFQCYDVFDTAMRDVEFSPDGQYFILVTTGGSADRNATSLCDTATRWSVTSSTPPGGAVEVWKNCTGGDTLLSVAVTGVAVYLGGHQRWLDNCGGRDNAVTGAFAASGIGALDPRTGRAIRTWNPGRTRGVGAEELVANGHGLYIGSDTERLGGEYHARLGLFPLS